MCPPLPLAAGHRGSLPPPPRDPPPLPVRGLAEQGGRTPLLWGSAPRDHTSLSPDPRGPRATGGFAQASPRLWKPGDTGARPREGAGARGPGRDPTVPRLLLQPALLCVLQETGTPAGCGPRRCSGALPACDAALHACNGALHACTLQQCPARLQWFPARLHTATGPCTFTMVSCTLTRCRSTLHWQRCPAWSHTAAVHQMLTTVPCILICCNSALHTHTAAVHWCAQWCCAHAHTATVPCTLHMLQWCPACSHTHSGALLAHLTHAHNHALRTHPARTLTFVPSTHALLTCLQQCPVCTSLHQCLARAYCLFATVPCTHTLLAQAHKLTSVPCVRTPPA